MVVFVQDGYEYRAVTDIDRVFRAQDRQFFVDVAKRGARRWRAEQSWPESLTVSPASGEDWREPSFAAKQE
jgi:hypothetical protein